MNAVTAILRFLSRPSVKYSAGVLLLGGIVVGLLGWGAASYTLEATSTESFCIGCHEMSDNAYVELQDTIHYSNRTGTRATCADCHVPHDLPGKIARKIEALREVYGKFTGIIETPEKYEAHRLVMAERVWADMREDDSAACRACHVNIDTSLDQQYQWARMNHEKAIENGQTCIDCHQGIAHKLPETRLMQKPLVD
ncbi:NapC/NirT family cytochrome c [Kistimonas asteriae]|uniref:NapC/NirT family cytochrome c n=1 Tax=Kistimonas asteriae TaxID=517724 RepID=UPI001BAC2883|nr:NapC/NirT family cytochrome c [Kistimonas asteriae]